MIDQIEKLKQDFTDKYVAVDASVPELARFEGLVGQIKTVNMNGRALVEFDGRANIGWYDIELDCLKVVPKPDATTAAKHAAPAAKPAAKTGAAPAAGEKKLSPLELARMQGAAKKPGEGAAPPAAGAKKSTVDILAAARGAKAAGAPAAEKSAPAAKPKMNTADILAAARAKKAAEPSDAAPEAEAPEAEAPVAAAPATAPAKTSAPALPKGQRPTVPEILAWCRAHDAK